MIKLSSLDAADTLIEFKDAVLQKEDDQWKNSYFSELTDTLEQTPHYIPSGGRKPSNWK